MEITQLSQLNLDKLYTYTDYLTWKFEERVELIKGKVFKMAAPMKKHQGISMFLSIKIGNYLENKPCKVYAAPFDVRLPIPKGDKTYTVVQPDLCIICDDSKTDDRGAIDAPDLVVEILSPRTSKTDLNYKFDLYQEAKVKEYWIVCPVQKSITIYILNKEDKYIGLKPLTEDNRLKSVLFPSLEFDLKRIFDY